MECEEPGVEVDSKLETFPICEEWEWGHESPPPPSGDSSTIHNIPWGNILRGEMVFQGTISLLEISLVGEFLGGRRYGILHLERILSARYRPKMQKLGSTLLRPPARLTKNGFRQNISGCFSRCLRFLI